MNLIFNVARCLRLAIKSHADMTNAQKNDALVVKNSISPQ